MNINKNHSYNLKKYSFYLLFFLAFFLLPFALYALEAETEQKQKDVLPTLEELEQDKILEFTQYNLFNRLPSTFYKVPKKKGTLYSDIEKQLPAKAYLLDVFVPMKEKQDIDRGEYDRLTHLVYLYSMPLLLHEGDRMQKLQESFVRHAFVSILNLYNPLAAVKSTSNKAIFEWEEKVYIRLMRGDSIHFRYPRHKAKNGESEIYSMFQNYPLDDNNNTGAFLSTYIFVRKQQIYFLTASSFLMSNEYYKELMWTRNSLEDFIPHIIPKDIN